MTQDVRLVFGRTDFSSPTLARRTIFPDAFSHSDRSPHPRAGFKRRRGKAICAGRVTKHFWTDVGNGWRASRSRSISSAGRSTPNIKFPAPPPLNICRRFRLRRVCSAYVIRTVPIKNSIHPGEVGINMLIGAAARCRLGAIAANATPIGHPLHLNASAL